MTDTRFIDALAQLRRDKAVHEIMQPQTEVRCAIMALRKAEAEHGQCSPQAEAALRALIAVQKGERA